MKKTPILVSMLLVIWVAGLSACTNATKESEYIVDQSDMVNTHALLTTTTGTITEAEKNGLIKMREEEKLARDVYTMLWEKRGNQTFKNISQSEQTHTDAIKDLLVMYNIDDPVKNDDIWVFTSKDMGLLYVQLLTKGNQSLGDALAIWATIEDLDIKDLNELLKETTNENIIAVYTNLNKGSRNHMRAFVKNIEKNNETYTPQYISNSEYSDIISSSQETGMKGNRNTK